ncbi:hypothetical protein C4A77_12780 [Brevibacillus laterosporus]|uniref:Uncharacterized protein n=1 Tax=Brevibacillus laterosporus TaxID=1465 RepID=A0AAP8U512_BRELA|nr:hypothetical protein C4A77_12780 [Brevibacillus laterosporus]
MKQVIGKILIRECGLKHFFVWICTATNSKVYRSLPGARIETLLGQSKCMYLESFLARERGLKLDPDNKIRGSSDIAPYTGAGLKHWCRN